MAELEFRESDHSYHLDGRQLPSVTAVLAQLADYSHVDPAVLAYKRDIGIATHAAIDLHLRGDLNPSSIADPWAPYFHGWLRFARESGFVADYWERRMASAELGYAGTVDLVGTINGRRCVIDTKTVTTIVPAVVGPQTAAYARLANEPTAQRFALQLMPDGAYRLVPLNNPQDYLLFLAALKVHNWRTQHGL